MKERLELILEKYGISASKLAEMLDVQRSGISHILAGRNNPSFDFLVRLTEVFPALDANWLLTGEGKMLKDDNTETKQATLNLTPENGVVRDNPPPDANETTTPPDIPDNPQEAPDNEVYKSKQVSGISKQVDAMVILYTDGTFKRYRPE